MTWETAALLLLSHVGGRLSEAEADAGLAEWEELARLHGEPEAALLLADIRRLLREEGPQAAREALGGSA